jgi:hypothetical protein
LKTRLLAASAILAASTWLGAASASAATPTPQATRALKYLEKQQQPDGSIPDGFGTTADYALGAKFHGLDPNDLKASSGNSVYDYLSSWAENSVGCSAAGSKRDGNSLGKLVQVVVAGGRNPTSFGGRNLLADLEGPGGITGGVYDATTGTYADCASGNQNAAYAQANAILGLTAAANPQYPVPPAAIQRLRAMQGTGGGWAAFGEANTNATAMAMMALGSRLQTSCGAPPDPTLAAALRYLRTQQDPASGGFAYLVNTWGSDSDPNSDALVIQALVAVGEDPGGPAWTNAKGNAPADLLTFQDSTSGGFRAFHGAATPDAFTTSQVPAGLDRAPFPDGSAHLAVVVCPTPSPTSGTAAAAAPNPAPSLPRAGAGRPGAPLLVAVLLLPGGLGLLLWRASARRSRRDG